MNAKDLTDFETWCIETYHKKMITSPIHLSGSKDGHLEEELIKIFKTIKPQDYIFTTYRSHYHALLKGMPKERLQQWILDNKSIHVMDKENKVITTAIVGGHLSQAIGAAMAIKIKHTGALNHKFETEKNEINTTTKQQDMPHVYVFCGDMTASIGVFEDCWNYANRNDLPITFIIEDNGLSTDTPTKHAWGMKDEQFKWESGNLNKIKFIKYQRIHPHYGTGKRIDFDDNKT